MRRLEETLGGFNSLQLEQLGVSSQVLRASFELAGKRVTYPLSELSPGTRELIALCLILHALIARGETVILDEPTTHVSRRESWLLQAIEAAEESSGQLILVSRETEIVNYLAKDYGLLFSREDSGNVSTKPYSAVQYTGLEPAEILARGWEDE